MIEKVEGSKTVIKTGSLKLAFLTFFLIAFSCAAHGEVDVLAQVDRNQIRAGESFTLQVSIESSETMPVNPPRLPTIANVQLLHKWSSSQTRMNMVTTAQGMDMQTVRSKIFSYQYVAPQEGTVVIEPIEVEVGGDVHTTEPIEITVLAQGSSLPRNSQRPQQAQPQRPSFPRDPIEEMEERFNQLLNRQFGNMPGIGGGFATDPGDADEAFFIVAEVDKTQAYKGEQITAAWYLYTRGRVRDIDTLQYPTLKGFWKEDIQISTRLDFEQDVINGVPYNRALLASYALFPIDAGKQVIDAYKAKATIVGGFGFGRGMQGTKASDRIPILIKPLPEEGKPNDFAGAVGEFKMKVEPPKQQIYSHQPFAIKVRFDGRGNAKLIELPKIPLPSSVEIYDIKNESRFFKNGTSYKEFEVLLIPNEPGDVTIDGLTTSYFDPKKEEYVTLTSEPIHLKVLQGSKQQSIGEERLKSNKKKKALPGLVKNWDPNLKKSRNHLIYWVMLFVFAGLVICGKLLIDLGLFDKQPSLEDIIGRRFAKIDKLVNKGQTRKVGIEATNAVYLVMGHLAGEGGSSEELDKVLAKTAPSVRREIEGPLRKLMDDFGLIGFGPDDVVEQHSKKEKLVAQVQELKKLLLKACELSKGNVSVG